MNKFIFTLVFCCFALLLQAQGKTLSAEEAVKVALSNNFNIQVAEKQLTIAEMNNKWSEAGMFPTVSLTAAFNNGIQDNTNNPFTFTPGIIMSQGFTPALAANWNMFSGFSVWITKERLEQLEAQSKGNSMLIIENTIQDVLKAYYIAVLHQERLKVLGLVQENSSKRLKYYELKEKYSKSSSLELLQFKNQFLTDSTNTLLQELTYRNAMRNLMLLMNEGEQSTFMQSLPMLTDKLEVKLNDLDEVNMQKELLANNQNLKNQYITLELQKTMVELQRSFLYPTVGFQAVVSPSFNNLRNLQDPNMQFETQVLNYSANFNLRYNVFNNWKTKRALEVAKIQEEIASLNVQSMEQTMKSNLSSLLELYRLRSQLVSLSEENKVYAEKLWEMTQKRFEMGLINSIELATIQNTYQNTLIQHYENLYNRMETYLELYKLTGKLGLQVK
jgi:outer membrane protein TolC